MQVRILAEDELYLLCEKPYNPPDIQNQYDEERFQEEVKSLYDTLTASLSQFGQEGDYYGVSDFAVRPCLKTFPTVIPRADPVRVFNITILTREFYNSAYLQALRHFSATEAMNYQIWIDQDFDSEWIQTIILTVDLAQIYCTNPEELDRVTRIFSRL